MSALLPWLILGLLLAFGALIANRLTDVLAGYAAGAVWLTAAITALRTRQS